MAALAADLGVLPTPYIRVGSNRMTAEDDALPELSDAEFHATYGQHMAALEVQQIAVADLQSKAADLLLGRSPDLKEISLRFESAYRAEPGDHVHYLFWYGVPNVYLVLVGDARSGLLRGYHRLDLNEKYGLQSPLDPVWSRST
jgi:hypothetical protein